jgi:hypothetical protein
MRTEMQMKENTTRPRIRGGRRFRRAVKQALDLLSDKIPRDYALVLGNVYEITEGKYAQMWCSQTRPRMELNRQTVFQSKAWCAATLVHEALHSKLYLQRIANGENGEIPDPVEEERICISESIRILRATGGSPAEIDFLEYADGRHCLRPPPDAWVPQGLLGEIIRRFIFPI